MSKKLIIIGLGPQGLFLLREFCRIGFKVTGIGGKSDIAGFSRYGNKIFVASGDELIKKLTQIAKDSNTKQDCYITSGYYLSYIVRNFPKSFDLFNMSPAPFEDVKLLINKSNTYSCAKNCGIRTLESFTLTGLQNNPDNQSLNYPLIAKWNQDLYLFNKPDFKAKTINNQYALEELLQTSSDEEKRYILIQPFLGADLKNNISYGGYFENGRCIAAIAVNEVRHSRTGISSFVKEYKGEYLNEIIESAHKLIASTNITGFLDVEFKIKDDKVYLLEVNPRPFGFIKILKMKYPNLISHLFTDDKLDLVINNKKCQWSNILRDTMVILKRLVKSVNIIRFLRDISLYLNRTILDVFDIKDLKPFFSQIAKRINA